MKQNQMIQPVISADFMSVSFVIADGGPAPVLDMTKVHENNRLRAAAHGFAQVRIIDAAAIPAEDKKTGRIRSREERMALKREAIEELIAHYHTGTPEWSIRAEGAGARSITIEALAAVKGWTYEKASEEVTKYAASKFNGERAKALAKFRESKQVSEKILEIQKSRLPEAKADADAMLAELGA